MTEIEDSPSKDDDEHLPMTPILAALIDATEAIDSIYSEEDPKKLMGLTSGYPELDRITGGFEPGNLIVVASRPSMGTSALSHSFVRHVSLELKQPSLLFSMEHTARQLVFRNMAAVGRLNAHHMVSGYMDEGGWNRITHAIGSLQGAPIFFKCKGRFEVGQILQNAQEMAMRVGKPGLIVVENLQMMADSVRAESRAATLAHYQSEFKALAMDLSVPVIVISKLSRAVESRPNKRPVLSDLRDSGGIEDVADQVIFLYRDDFYNPDSNDRGLAEIIVAKNKNGPLGTTRLVFLSEYLRFENDAGSSFHDEGVVKPIATTP